MLGFWHAGAEWVATENPCNCRWNAAEHSAGSVHLELLPMLLGFFTYKAGVAGRGIFELLRGLSEPSRTSQDEAADLAGESLSCPSERHHRPVGICDLLQRTVGCRCLPSIC